MNKQKPNDPLAKPAYEIDLQTIRRWEWPTLLVIVVIFASWLALVPLYQSMSGWVWFPLMAIITAWQTSLQHEILHGHPINLAKYQDALGLPSFNLIYPYQLYKKLHLKHHRDEQLTNPNEDPESKFILPNQIPKNPWFKRLLASSHTFLGATIFAPFLNILWVWSNRHEISGKQWASHAIMSAAIVAYLMFIGQVPILLYLLLVCFPAIMLITQRSFAEHGLGKKATERTAVVQSNWFWQLLFLNNNFHIVHHQRPGLAWYEIKPLWKKHRHAWLKLNGNFYYTGYTYLWNRYGIKPFSPLIHPEGKKLIAEAKFKSVGKPFEEKTS